MGKMKNKAIDIANDRRESNILIAEFMGYTYAEQEDLVFKPGEVTKKDGKIRKANGDFTHCNLLRYHESWDKLMPVVKKCYEYGELIETMTSYVIIDSQTGNRVCNICNDGELCDDNTTGVCAMCIDNRVEDGIWTKDQAYDDNLMTDGCGCIINPTHRDRIIETLSGIIYINETYQAVAEFIKWYNEAENCKCDKCGTVGSFVDGTLWGVDMETFLCVKCL